MARCKPFICVTTSTSSNAPVTLGMTYFEDENEEDGEKPSSRHHYVVCSQLDFDFRAHWARFVCAGSHYSLSLAIAVKSSCRPAYLKVKKWKFAGETIRNLMKIVQNLTGGVSKAFYVVFAWIMLVFGPFSSDFRSPKFAPLWSGDTPKLKSDGEVKI